MQKTNKQKVTFRITQQRKKSSQAQKLRETRSGKQVEHTPLLLGSCCSPGLPDSHIILAPYSGWDHELSLPKGTRTCCHSLQMLGIRCLYLSTYQRKPPATKLCNPALREGGAPLRKNISNFNSNPHYKTLGEKEQKEVLLRKLLRQLFSLNRKHFVMEKFYLWPMKQSVFCIIHY